MRDASGNVPGIRPEFILAAALFLTLGAMRLNDLFLYTPDSARYLIWGNSLARGEGYLDDTQPEPLRFVVHAPLYPALIAPVEFLLPLQPFAVKAYTLLWGLVAMLLFYLWLYNVFGRGAAITGAAMLGFNPAFLVYSTEILSEAPFIAFLLLALYIVARADDVRGLSGPAWWTLLAATSLVGLLREVGIVAAVCVAVALWHRERRKAIVVIVCAVACAGAWYVRNAVLVGAPPGSPGGNAGLVLQHFLTAPDGSIVNEIVRRAWTNVSSYATYLGGMAFYPLYGEQHSLLLDAPVGVHDALRRSVVAVLGGAMAWGVVRAFRSGPLYRLPVGVGVALLAAAVVYPVTDVRFLAPILPLMIFVILVALRPGREGGLRLAGVLTGVAAALIIIPNIPALAGLVSMNSRYLNSPEDLSASFAGRDAYPYYYTQPWGDLGEWIEANVPTDAILATPAKELAVVSGGRKVMELDPGVAQSVFDRLLTTNDVSYLLAPSRWADLMVYEPLMAGSRRTTFTEVRTAGNLHIFRIAHVPFDEDRPSAARPRGQAGAVEHLRAARDLIRSGDYHRASVFLDSASLLAPARPEVLCETVVAASLSGDSTAAAASFGRLIELQQVASYIVPARNHIRTAELVRAASALPRGEERAMRTLDVSRLYWEMGFYDHAKRLLAPEMRDDSTFFVGHLWNFHFNFQTGDTAAARVSLGRLNGIDSVNSLVRNFHRLMDLRQELRQAPSPAQRSVVRLRMAGIYRDIELFDESADQGEAALADDPSSSSAQLFLADLYAKLGYLRRALPIYRAYLDINPADFTVRALADSLAGPAGR